MVYHFQEYKLIDKMQQVLLLSILRPCRADKLHALTGSTPRLKCVLPNLNDGSGVSLAEEYTPVGVRSQSAGSVLCYALAGIELQLI